MPQQYPTIQAGVLAAAPGDRVVVEEGTYSELVTIATPNIDVVGEEGAILDGTAFGGAGAVVTNGILVQSNGVTVRGFTVRNYGTGIASTAGGTKIQANTVNACLSGILCSIHGADPMVAPKSTVDHNIVNGNFDGIVLDFSQTVTVTHNEANENTDSGIVVEDGTIGCTVSHNEVNNNGTDGIFVDFTCSGNTLSQNTGSGNGLFDGEDQGGEFLFFQNDWDHNKFGTSAGI